MCIVKKEGKKKKSHIKICYKKHPCTLFMDFIADLLVSESSL